MKKSVIGSSVALGLFGALVIADQVINDDLIVTFSECVGNDCVNGENFGFDTIRMKENNTRLKFDDTSNSGSFPNNDWTIVANDSSNGGANYLAIEDATAGRIPFRVEAGARANALVVEADGDVGFGTLNPAVDLHYVNGNTPTLRLDQDGSSGFSSQAWDIAGNETNFFIRDVTNGSALPFRIRPGADESALDIHADNDIGIGTSSPDARLHVNIKGGDEPSFLINQDGTADSTQFMVDSDGQVGINTDDPKAQFHIVAEGTQTFRITDSTGSHHWNINIDTGGNLNFSKAGSGTTELVLTASGNIVLNGNLVVNGNISCTGTC
ncbi:MAG: hypothetical protein HWE11_06160 [Gammaproteobacteria bacterium]|nr:hypothetical protein [Gammaproteobacteria bacterium]